MSKLSGLLLTTILSTSAFTLPAFAGTDGKTAGDFLIRGRLLAIQGDLSSTISPIGGDAQISDEVVPEVDFSYFFTDHIAAELIIGATRHDVAAKNTLLGDVDLGTVWLVPPTVTLQYHFAPSAVFSPYVGAGVNYTTFHKADLPAGLVSDVDYGSSMDLALQAGADIKWQGPWYFNVDLKKVYINTDVKLNAGTITADVDLDPWAFGIGVGRLF
ncbi:MAG: OmpW family protein [Alphaproteobacteria bacterium]|nr:MAG: OmpW family protein [Alphaproteobacteria bacterium]